MRIDIQFFIKFSFQVLKYDLLQFVIIFIYLFFGRGHAVAWCGISVPRPGIEPGPQWWNHWALTTGPPGNSWALFFKMMIVARYIIWRFIHGLDQWNPSHVCDLCHSSQQCWILNPLSEARDQTCNLKDTSQVCNPLSHSRNSSLYFLFIYFCESL